MRLNTAQDAPETNVVPMPSPKRQGRISRSSLTTRQRFRILPFTNSGGSISYRVQGMTRDGKYLRQNLSSSKAAEVRRAELEAEYHTIVSEDTALRSTVLSREHLQIAEMAIAKMGDDWDKLLDAVELW